MSLEHLDYIQAAYNKNMINVLDPINDQETEQGVKHVCFCGTDHQHIRVTREEAEAARNARNRQDV